MNAKNLVWYLANALITLIGVTLYNIETVSNWIGEELNGGIAAGFIATGICGIITYVVTFRAEDRYERFANMQAAGLSGIFRSRSATIRNEYSERINKAKSIDIMGFGLSAFREDYGSRFQEMASSKKFRILIANPDFPSLATNYCNQRDFEEENVIGQISADIQQFIAASASARNNYPNNFQIRKMKTLPSVNIFRMDRDILWGPYLVKDQSRNMPTMLVNADGYLYDSLFAHFEAIWTSDDLSEAV